MADPPITVTDVAGSQPDLRLRLEHPHPLGHPEHGLSARLRFTRPDGAVTIGDLTPRDLRHLADVLARAADRLSAARKAQTLADHPKLF